MSAETNSIAEQVRTILAEHLGRLSVDFDDDAALHDDLDMDDLDTEETVLALEEHFGLEMPADEVERLVTVRDLLAYVERRVAAR